MSRTRSLLRSRSLLLALVLAAAAATTACGASAFTGPVACDPMDARDYDWTADLSPDDARATLPGCPHGAR